MVTKKGIKLSRKQYCWNYRELVLFEKVVGDHLFRKIVLNYANLITFQVLESCL